jgi:predicted O-linked N-acetylglucosamine transferase (SPINDLY family)
MLGRFTEAVAVYETALKYLPDSAVCYCCLGLTHIDLGDISRAQECLLKAQQLDPNDPLIAIHLGTLYLNMGYRRDAIETYLKGLHSATSAEYVAELSLGLGNVYDSIGQIQEAIAISRSGLASNPGNASLHSNLLLMMQYSADVTPDEILNESIAWGDNHSPKQLLNSRNVGGLPLKIAFLSADFRDHSVSYFFEPLLANLNRDRFKVYCYSGVKKPDAVTERLKSQADCWIDTFNTPDELLAEKIAAEKIDILVDLSGHTSGNRLGVFARRAAPLQVTWLGYPGTTGLRTMDYRISDAVADPIGISDAMHTEKLVRLPQCFLCYQPPQDAPEVSLLPLSETKTVTFGSFNNLAKITPQTLTVWGEILGKIAGSRLVLKNRAFADDDVVSHWLKLLEEHGVEPARVSLVPFVLSSWKHLAHYAKIDIALDTFPYNGTTTTCEALWMGVPVITLSGDRHSARVGASLLSCVGLHELVTENWNDYVAKAVQLAGDVEQLQLYRRTMRERMLVSPLCDGGGFAKRWEDILFKMLSEQGLR